MKNISISELARRINQSPQNFNKKLKHGTIKAEEMVEIAGVLGIEYEQKFALEDGSEIRFNNNVEIRNIL